MDWEWSDRLDEAEWIAVRQPTGSQVCTVPTGFAGCVRLLHPVAAAADWGVGPTDQVRWSQLARWSGVRLDPATRFWQVALPESLPVEPVPGDGEPASDLLGLQDGRALARILRTHTTTPERCWFGLWVGYGWVEPGVRVRPDDPARFSARPLVRLPGRDYLLYSGSVEAAVAFVPEQRELADLWWPQDRAWFVYGDVDLNSTYVAGSTELINALLGSHELEAVVADSNDPVVTGPGELPDWLGRRVDETVADLLAGRRAELSTSRFRATFELAPQTADRWRLDYRCDDARRREGYTILPHQDLAVHVQRTIIRTITTVVEG